MSESRAHAAKAKLALLAVSTALAWSACGDSNDGGGVKPSDFPPAARIVEPSNAMTVTSASITAKGTFAPDGLTDTNDIWVLVWPQLANGKAYPQSPNAARGDPATVDRANRSWSTPVSLGGPNQTYRISVHAANSMASRALREFVSEWARTGNFAGLTPDQVPKPPDFVELHSISITKMEPPSSVQITDPRDAAVVGSAVITVRGTYAPQTLVDDNDIWVLVWPALAGGKGYPQSPNAAAGEPATLNRATQTWSVPAALGGPNQGYRISVHTADAVASRVLRQYLIDWSRNQDFVGLYPDQIPTGLIERHSITVTKAVP